MSKKLCIVVCLLAAGAFGYTKGGMVVASGEVSVAGQRVQRSTSIFSGEKLQTGKDGEASITADGAVASVAHSTTLDYQENGLDLKCGAVQVVTLEGFWVNVNGIKAAPVSAGKVRFRARQTSSQVKINVLEGSLAVDQGSSHKIMTAGQSQDFSNPALCKDPPPGWVPAAIFSGAVAPFLFPRDHEPISGLEPDE